MPIWWGINRTEILARAIAWTAQVVIGEKRRAGIERVAITVAKFSPCNTRGLASSIIPEQDNLINGCGSHAFGGSFVVAGKAVRSANASTPFLPTSVVHDAGAAEGMGYPATLMSSRPPSS